MIMMFNFYQKFMALALGLMLAGSIASVRCADLPAPIPARPNNAVWAKTEILTAVLRAPLTMYNAKMALSDNEIDKKTLVGAGTDLIRAANESLALYNTWEKGDLAYPANGNQFYQFASLLFIAQDLGSALIKCGKFMNISPNFLEDDEDNYFDTTKENVAQTEKQQKLTLLAKKLVVYVLPAVESIAAVTRAYESHRAQQNMDNRLKVLNYLCFTTIAGCRNLSEHLTTRNGSWAEVLTIVKTVTCSALLITDIARIIILDEIPGRVGNYKQRAEGAEAARQSAIHEKDEALEQKATAERERRDANRRRVEAEDAREAKEQERQAALHEKQTAEQLKEQALQARIAQELTNVAEYDALNLPREKTSGLFYADNSAQRKADRDPLTPNEVLKLYNARRTFELLWNRQGREANPYDANTESIAHFIARINTPEYLQHAGAMGAITGIADNPLIKKNMDIFCALQTAINARIPAAEEAQRDAALLAQPGE